jgi:hypothetical protein
MILVLRNPRAGVVRFKRRLPARPAFGSTQFLALSLFWFSRQTFAQKSSLRHLLEPI